MAHFHGDYITKDDAKIAKNYLLEMELTRLNLLVALFLERLDGSPRQPDCLCEA